MSAATAEALSAALGRAAGSNKTVRSAQLWEVWSDLCGPLATDPNVRAWLAATLEAAEVAGLVTRSKKTDRGDPALPTTITLVRDDGPLVAERPAFPWCPELSWASVSARRLPDAVHADLETVHQYVVSSRAAPPAPVPWRYRSFELLGDEKRLAALVGIGLELATVHAHSVPLAASAAEVGDGDIVLITENLDPFWVLTEALRGRDDHRVGRVVYGGGNAISATAMSLPRLLPGTWRVRYAGDLDYEGLQIASRATAALEAAGWDDVAPATGLYRQLLGDEALARPSGGAVDPAVATLAAAWVGPELAAVTYELLTCGRRVAQEATLPGGDWLDGLS